MRLPSMLAAGALALFATPALADITVLSGQTPGPLDPVTLQDDTLDFIISGLVGAEGAEVTFTGAENLVVQGQRIQAAVGTLNFLLFTLADPAFAFTAAEFNLNAVADGATSIMAFDQFGEGFGGVFDLSGGGNNFFNIAAAEGQVIRSIVVMSTAALDDVRQIRLGGVAAVVPESASWAMMILGFGGVGGALRVRRRRLLPA